VFFLGKAMKILKWLYHRKTRRVKVFKDFGDGWVMKIYSIDGRKLPTQMQAKPLKKIETGKGRDKK